ncbi:MAG TPA: NAD(P)/FAD-dependent oxidoreductase [Nitrolancea sp.]
MEQYDVVVVGGGPSGAAVARDIAAAGYRVAILERDRDIGQPVQCSGLVTERTLAAAGISPEIAHNQLVGAAIHAPSGARYDIGGDRVHAYVLDRTRFDLGMMIQALDLDVDVHSRARLVDIARDRDGLHLSVETNDTSHEFLTQLVIGADGPRSIVAQFLELPPPIEVLRARGADVRLPAKLATDQVLIFTGERYAAGFFAWLIPLGGDRFRLGWGTSRPGNGQTPRNLTDDYPGIFRGMEILSQTGGLIPLGPRPVTSGAGGMVVGDAAGQAKATSGGGLFTALTCARHCAQTALDALRAGDFSAEKLSSYDHNWRADIGVELDHATALRSAYRELSDADLDLGLSMLRFRGMRAIVNRYGDIDYPSVLAARALRAAPSLLRLAHGRGNLRSLIGESVQSVVSASSD